MTLISTFTSGLSLLRTQGGDHDRCGFLGMLWKLTERTEGTGFFPGVGDFPHSMVHLRPLASLFCPCACRILSSSGNHNHFFYRGRSADQAPGAKGFPLLPKFIPRILFECRHCYDFADKALL